MVYRTNTSNRLFRLILPLVGLALICSGSLFADTEKAKDLCNQGITAMKSGDQNAAIVAFEAALKEDANYSDAYINLGAIYFEQKEYDRAMNLFQTAAEKNPQNVDAFANLGRVNRKLRKYAEAEAAFRSAIGIAAQDGDLYRELGMILYLKKNYAEVISTLEECHRLNAGDHLTHYMLGKSQQKQGNLTAAIASLNASNQEKKNYNAHFLLGTIYLNQEKYSKAATEFKAAEKLDSGKAYKAAFNYAVAMENQDPEALDANIANWERFVQLGKKSPKANADVSSAQDHIKELRDKKEHVGLQGE